MYEIEEKVAVEEPTATATKEVAPVETIVEEPIVVDTGSIEQFGVERVSTFSGKKVKNYVDNDAFCNAIIQWNTARVQAELDGLPRPQMPNEIGKHILNMADGLSRRFNFRNYTYVDEMKDDAIYTATRAVKNFDPTKSENAFGYFNFIMSRAMVTRLLTEKAEHEGKMELLRDPMYLGYTADTQDSHHVDKSKIIEMYENGH